jgi:PAS domain S-box-containing protein
LDNKDCGVKPSRVTSPPADAMFRRMVECTGQGIGWADLDGNIVYMNPSLRRMLDLAPDAEVSGLHLRRFRLPEAEPMAGEMLRIARDQGGWSGEMPLLSEQGRVIPTRHDIHLLRDDAGIPIAIACVITDLSLHKRHEQSLRESKSKYRALVENIPQRVFYKDRQSRYLAVNRNYAEDKGISPQDVIGRDDLALNPRDLADKYRLDDQRIMDSGQAEEYDETIDRDGRRITVHTIKTPVRDEDGQVIGVCGIYWDVTEQRAAFERVEMLQRVVDFSTQPIGWADLDGTARYFNPALRRLLGVTEGEDVSRYRIDDFYSESYLQTLRAKVLPEVMALGHWHGEFDITALDGCVIPTLHNVFLLRNSVGQPIALANILTELSEQKRVEAELRAERNFTGAVLDNADALLLVLDREGRICRFNRACEKISGYRFAEVEGRLPWEILLLPEERDRVREQALLALSNHAETLTNIHTNHWLDKDGGKHLLEWHRAPLLDDQGRLEYLVAIGIDVTEKHQVEAALRRSQETHAQAEAVAHLGSWDLDMATGVLRWTDEVFRIFGYPPQSFVATHDAFMESVHPDDRQQVIDAVNASIADANTAYAVEHRVIRPDGEIRIVKERAKVYRDASDKPFRMIGSVHDITEQKLIELELERYRSHLEDLVRERTAELERESNRNAMVVNTALDGFFTADLDRRMLICNDNYCRMLGYSRDELLRLNIADIEAIDTPEEIAARCMMIRQQGHDRFETRHRRQDGSLLDVEVSVTLARIGDESQYFAFVRDISTRKEAEAALMRARDEAERANRAKSEFLSRMSHELRTPLNAILGFGQLLERANLGGLQTDNVVEILRAGRHLLELINEVLDLARIESGKFTISLEPVALLPLIADCVSLMRPQAENLRIDLIEATQACGKPVQADRTRLKQVLLNLLSNAVKYNREQGSVSIACVADDESVRIRVSDTGAGLSAEQQARLFVAFERLDADHNAIEGTGIGLALSKRLVELMGGSIGVESEAGAGSTFWLSLPLADAAAQAVDCVVPASAAPMPQAVAPHQYAILCIEDNPANLRLVERILAQRADIRLLSAGAPGLGLELAAAHRPSLILLDINLPDMDGFEVLRRLQAAAGTRAIPVIGISANAMPKDIQRARAAGFADYLTKPLDVGAFLKVVDAHLATKAEPA